MFLISDMVGYLDCEYELYGESTIDQFNGFASFHASQQYELCFIQNLNKNFLETLEKSTSRIILCRPDEKLNLPQTGHLYVLVDNPRLCFARTLRGLGGYILNSKPSSIHPTALISPDATLGIGVYVGPYVQIGSAQIGNYVQIESYSQIHDGAVIGNSVLISNHCNIGGIGFGFVKNQNSEYEYFPQIGSVRIEDYVSIFPYVNIDRGTLGETFIGRGTKIDHYCHIGHNSKIGYNNLITPNVTTLGGVTIGNECLIGCGSIFRENVAVGDGATIGMGSSVTRNVPAGEVWVGVPAKEFNEFKRINSQLSRLEER